MLRKTYTNNFGQNNNNMNMTVMRLGKFLTVEVMCWAAVEEGTEWLRPNSRWSSHQTDPPTGSRWWHQTLTYGNLGVKNMKVVKYTRGMSVTVSIDISVKIDFKYPSSNNNECDKSSQWSEEQKNWQPIKIQNLKDITFNVTLANPTRSTTNMLKDISQKLVIEKDITVWWNRLMLSRRTSGKH